jgi:hypothetical protein
MRPFHLPGAPAGSPRELWRWTKSGYKSGIPAGLIDLRRPRAMYNQGGWQLRIDGMDWRGRRPGEWESDGDEEEPCLAYEDPHWLLAILSGCVRAKVVDSKEIGRQPWQRTRLHCEFKLAAQRTELPLIPPTEVWMAADTSATDFDATRLDVPDLELDVFTDPTHRIRRVIRYEQAGRGEFALDDFGVDATLEVPR